MTTICDAAADAYARRSPAYPNLVAQCGAARAQAIASGIFVQDNWKADDPGYRVAVANRGEVIIGQNPGLAAQRASLPNVEQQRGFTMAQAVRAGNVQPGYVEWYAQNALGMAAEQRKGFLDAINGPGAGGGPVVQMTQGNNPDGSVGGVSKPVLIGAGVVGVLALGLVAFKLTR